MAKGNQTAVATDRNGGDVSIEKAILLDVCLGVPLGRIWLRMPAWQSDEPLAAGPETTLFRGEQLGLLKKMHQHGDGETVEAMAALTGMADAALERGPFSVTHKTGVPATEDPHDYYSLAKYWWPNEQSEDGYPYAKRDGHVNPDCYSDQYDFVELETFTETVLLLSLAAYLTERSEYGQHASRLLSAWFVDDETRQNPTFECAQAVPGKMVGRWQGLIEARRLIYVTEAVHLLEGANLLPSELSMAIRGWYSDFLDWMTESAHGKEAAARKNNIAFWYDLQRMVYADFCGREELATEIATEVVIPRLDEQLAEDGSLPAELARAHPHDYVAFTVMAMAMISSVGKKHGLELWDSREADGNNFRVAHDWLLRTTRTHELIDYLWPEHAQHEAADDTAPTGILSVPGLIDLGLQLRGARRIAEHRNAALEATQADLDRERRRRAELESELAQAEAAISGPADDSDQTQRETAEATGPEGHDSDVGGEGTEPKETGQEDTASLREQLEAREQEIERLQREFAAERDYLQAQLDTANAMWAFHANGGKAPVLHGSGDSGGSNGQEETKSERAEKRARPEALDDRETSGKKKRQVRDLARYAIELEAQYKALLASRSWRLTGPIRVLSRNAPRVLLRPPRQSNQWPKRPGLLRKAGSQRGEWNESVAVQTDSLPAEKLEQHRSNLERYALTLESKIRAVFGAASWKVAAPLRESVRVYRRVVKRENVKRGRLPRRPSSLEDQE